MINSKTLIIPTDDKIKAKVIGDAVQQLVNAVAHSDLSEHDIVEFTELIKSNPAIIAKIKRVAANPIVKRLFAS